MRAAGRAFGVVSIAAITVGLAGCIPSPPPLPQVTPTVPIVQGQGTPSEVREGFVSDDGTSTVELQVDERSAVVIGAVSTEGDDLMLHLTGPGTDLENDDAHGRIAVFDFEIDTRDPALVAVLDPGTYSIDVEEWSGESTSYRLQVLTGSTIVPTGDTASLAFAPGAPAVAIVTLATGEETIAATSTVDSSLWVYAPIADHGFRSDDRGGDRNPMIELYGETDDDVVVVLSGYRADDSGTAQLSVQ